MIVYRNILVPTDLSAGAEEALHHIARTCECALDLRLVP